MRGSKRIEDNAARLWGCYDASARSLFPPAPSERGHDFRPGPLSTNLVARTTSARFSLWTHGRASVLRRMNCKQTCRTLCGAASYGPMFARRRGLVIEPGVAPRLRACKPLSPNSDTTEIQRGNRAVHHRDFRGAESMGFKGEFPSMGGLDADRRLINGCLSRSNLG